MITLDEFIKDYPLIKYVSKETRTPEVNQKLLDFFDQVSMKGGGLSLHYERKPDFFRFLEYHSSDYYVFYGERDGKVIGTGTLILRPGLINGEKKIVGYMGDLRVQSDREFGKTWRHFHGQFIRKMPEIEEMHGAQHFITAILDGNERAINALVKDPKFPCDYLPKVPYKMFNILMEYPFLSVFSSSENSFEIVRAKEGDFKDIQEFYREQEKDRAFGFCFADEDDEIERRLKFFDEFTLENFYLVKENGKIIAACAPWSSSKARRVIIEQIPFSQNLPLKLLSPFTNVPKAGGELKILYLTLLRFSRDLEESKRLAIFRSLLKTVIRSDEFKDFHFLAFDDYPEHRRLQDALKSFIHFETTMTLYQVVDKERKDQEELFGEFPPGFEMALA